MKLYGVFVEIDGRHRWAMSYNQRKARKLARQHRGEVRVIQDDRSLDGGTCYGVDAPTFRVLSELIVSYE